jgi:hypothetical protein
MQLAAEMRYGVLALSESLSDACVCVCARARVFVCVHVCVCARAWERNRTSLHMVCLSVIAEQHRGGLGPLAPSSHDKKKKKLLYSRGK